ncbi:GGDEF domain-containing protein [Brevibacillus fulvus]|uniref:Diguanylate cyclase (GGDEF)-like protein n=1 Tax=Brevibacillus fulvus TaxID=1125967 RepID=A0A938Y4W8_9BACL|nr:GGDEF domain-containing protein [Brevibacillus fulvus]MBM7591996.1 diguanylate cyclase (GGDEF)-like protein [Brevibacillus fulvus]
MKAANDPVYLDLRRKIYLFVIPGALLGAICGLYFELLRNSPDQLKVVSSIAYVIWFSLMLFLIWKKISFWLVEFLSYVISGGFLLLRMVDQIYFADPSDDFAMVQFPVSVWFPSFYILTLLIFTNKLAKKFSILFFVCTLIITIPYFSNLLSKPLTAISSHQVNFFVQFFLSNILYIVLLFAFDHFRTAFTLSQNRLKLMNELVYRDTLTGLYNRRILTDMENESSAALKLDRRIAVMFLDLDGFKQVNDTYGHATGDQLLQQVAKRLQGCIREQDIACRLGGDEFSIILENPLSVPQVEAIAKSIVSALREGYPIGENLLTVTSSIGIAMNNGERPMSLNTLIAMPIKLCIMRNIAEKTTIKSIKLNKRN